MTIVRGYAESSKPIETLRLRSLIVSMKETSNSFSVVNLRLGIGRWRQSRQMFPRWSSSPWAAASRRWPSAEALAGQDRSAASDCWPYRRRRRCRFGSPSASSATRGLNKSARIAVVWRACCPPIGCNRLVSNMLERTTGIFEVCKATSCWTRSGRAKASCWPAPLSLSVVLFTIWTIPGETGLLTQLID